MFNLPVRRYLFYFFFISNLKIKEMEEIEDRSSPMLTSTINLRKKQSLVDVNM